MTFQNGIAGYIGAGIVNIAYGRKQVTGKKTRSLDAREVWRTKGCFVLFVETVVVSV